jgi:hypothetical protein
MKPDMNGRKKQYARLPPLRERGRALLGFALVQIGQFLLVLLACEVTLVASCTRESGWSSMRRWLRRVGVEVASPARKRHATGHGNVLGWVELGGVARQARDRRGWWIENRDGGGGWWW